jgi:hypothetical protein
MEMEVSHLNAIVVEEDEEVTKSFAEKIEITLDDLDFTDVLMPKFDISKHV